MPASRILEGSLPERHPKGPDLFWRPTTTQNGVRAGYQGRSPCLVCGVVCFWGCSCQKRSILWEKSRFQPSG